MPRFALCFIFVLCFVVSFTSRIPENDINGDNLDTLVHVQAFFRHADRAPTSTYPNDPYKGSEYWPDGFGQLTKVGKQHAYALGMFLRERYNKFLGETYRPQYVRARSTDFDRTLMTNALVQAAVYPPKGDQIWNPELLWQPVPIHTIDVEDDWLAQETLCPVSKEEMKKALQSEEILKIDDENKDLYYELEMYTGMDVNNIDAVADIHGTLLSEQSAGINLPDWTRKVFPHKTGPLAGKYFELYTSSDTLRTLIAGPVLREIKRNIAEKMNGKSMKQFQTYGTHDKIIAAILGALDIFDPILPGFASCVIVETHKLNDEKYGVKFLYRNTTSNMAYTLQLPGCDVICPYETFAERVEMYIPNDWNKQCGL